jgi:hypothetical protein
MKTLCLLVVLGGCGMLVYGGLALWPASDLAKSVEHDREFLARLNSGRIPVTAETLSRYGNDSLEYHEAMEKAYTVLARTFLISGGAFLLLGGWQLVLIRRAG